MSKNTDDIYRWSQGIFRAKDGRIDHG
jgi:hypothetical protein